MSTIDLADRVEELFSRVKKLEDQLAIAKLMASYGPAADSGSSDATGSLWLEDGLYDAKVVRFDGAARVAEMVATEPHQKFLREGAAHIVSAPVIEVDGDHAVGTCYQQVLLRDAEADGFRQWRVSANRWEMVRTAGTWKISSRWNRALNGDVEARELLAAAQHGAEHGAWAPRNEGETD